MNHCYVQNQINNMKEKNICQNVSGNNNLFTGGYQRKNKTLNDGTPKDANLFTCVLLTTKLSSANMAKSQSISTLLSDEL